MNSGLYQGKYRIDPARLAGYDYGSNGMYFITICTHNREPYFGSIVETTSADQSPHRNYDLKPSLIGQVAIDCWYAIPLHFPFVVLDAFQIMPNHLHGILWICKPDDACQHGEPNTFGPQRKNLASIIRGFKIGVKKQATIMQLEFAWQPAYYDRIVRNDDELNRIRVYIANNPGKWVDDRNNANGLYM